MILPLIFSEPDHSGEFRVLAVNAAHMRCAAMAVADLPANWQSSEDSMDMQSHAQIEVMACTADWDIAIEILLLRYCSGNEKAIWVL